MNAMREYLSYVVLAYLTLLPVTNPLTSAAMLLALGKNFSIAERQRQINRATFFVWLIIVVSFYAGNAVMQLFGISIPGMRIAGGMIVAYIGFSMLFPATSTDETHAQVEMATDSPARRPRDISFVPLALPGTAGPGTIALVISAASTIADGGGLRTVHHAVVLTSTTLICLTLWICLRGAHAIAQFLGTAGIDAISRVMGFLLVCLGVQFVIDGGTDLLSQVTSLTGGAIIPSDPATTAPFGQ